MRGKQPKEREHYVLRTADGILVEVNRKVYLEWYQSRRRERYQNEQNRKHGICSLDELEEKGNFSKISVYVAEELEETEETALRHIYGERVRQALGSLSEDDARLIELLYFMEIAVTDVAQIYGCSRKTVQNRRKRVLQELRQKMMRWGK